MKFASLPKSTHQIIGGYGYNETFLLNQYGYPPDSEPYGDRLLTYWSYGGSSAATSYGTLASNTWQHLAVTIDNGSIDVYIDGVWNTGGSQNANSNAYNWNNAIGIGGRSNGTWGINGRIDDVALWPYALEPELIAALAAGASPLSIPEPSTLVLAAFGLLGLSIGTRRKRRR